MVHFVTVEDACELVTDGTHYTPKNVGNGVPFLTVRDVTDSELDFASCSFITDTDFKLANDGNCAPKRGDVLFSKDGTVGKVHVVATDQPFAILSSLAILRPKKGAVDAQYLGHALRSPATLNEAIKKKTGSAIRRIILSDLKRVRLPLPSISEQRRIAAILDQAEALRAKRREALTQLDSLTQSIFIEMFGDPATSPKNCVLACLGEAVSEMQYGPRFYNEAYSPEGMRIVRITDLDASGSLDFDSMPRMDIDEDAHAQFILRPGDIVFARTGATVGKVALIDLSSPPCIAGAYFIRLRFKDSVLPEYAYSVLRTKSVQSLIARQSRQAAQQNFSGPGLRRLPMPIPSLTLQQEFKARLTVIQQMTSVHQRSLAQLSLLLASLQHRAFRGEL